MNTSLDYKTETEVSSIVKGFWSKYFAGAFLWALFTATCFYQSVSFDIQSGRPPLVFGLFTVGVFSFIIGATALAMFVEYRFNLATRIVEDEKCLKLSKWMSEHAPVAAYVQHVSTKRAVVLYDYFVVARWVGEAEHDARLAQQQLACKRIQGIA